MSVLILSVLSLMKVEGLHAINHPSSEDSWQMKEGGCAVGKHRNSLQCSHWQPSGAYRLAQRTTLFCPQLPVISEPYQKFLSYKLPDSQSIQTWWSFSTRNHPGPPPGGSSVPLFVRLLMTLSMLHSHSYPHPICFLSAKLLKTGRCLTQPQLYNVP